MLTREKLAQDEKVRFIKGNDFKFIRIELLSFFIFMSVYYYKTFLMKNLKNNYKRVPTVSVLPNIRTYKTHSIFVHFNIILSKKELKYIKIHILLQI